MTEQRTDLRSLLPDAPELPAPGIWPKIAFDEYLALPAVDFSLLKAMAHAPEVARYRMSHPEDDKPAYIKGRLFHLLCTESGKMDEEFVLKPKTYVNEKGVEKPWHGGANVCKAMLADWAASGLTPLAQDVFDEAWGMSMQVRNHEKLGPLVRKAQVEVSVIWTDPDTNLACKGRWDTWKADVVGDLKSTTNAEPEAWWKEAYGRKYHLQCAMYVDAKKILAPSDRVAWFVFGVAEGYAPYLVSAHDVHDDPDAQSYPFLELGRRNYHALLQRFKWCMENDDWPGYGSEHHDMMLPAWVDDQEDFSIR